MSINHNRKITSNVLTNKEFNSIQYRHLFGYWYEYYCYGHSKRKFPKKRIVQHSWKEHRKTQYKN